MIKRLLQVFLFSLCAASLAAFAQAYPSKPIRIVVPFGPGSATDTITRMLIDKAGKSLGTTFVVDGEVLLKRFTLVIRGGRIEKVFYPIFPPTTNADDVIAWLRASAKA